MANKLISLHEISATMLIVEHPSGVRYRNQVGGVATAQEEVEGVLSPLDVGEDLQRGIETCPYPQGRRGISSAIADTLDALLASQPATTFLSVDRGRLDESWEAWIYVLIASPETDDQSLFGPYFGPVYGFGAARGVLTWCNSD